MSSPLIPAYKAGFVGCALDQYLPVPIWAVPPTITPHIFCLPEFCGSTAYFSRKNSTGIAPIPVSVVRETIALLKTGSASYCTEKMVPRTAVGIADCRTQIASCSRFRPNDRQIPQATIGEIINLTAEAHNAGNISLESMNK